MYELLFDSAGFEEWHLVKTGICPAPTNLIRDTAQANGRHWKPRPLTLLADAALTRNLFNHQRKVNFETLLTSSSSSLARL